MTEIVINKDFGGFGLSRIAQEKLCEKKGISPGVWTDAWGGYYAESPTHDISRDDPDLLSIVKEIVASHGGESGVLSEPGKGSTFWFTLPLATPESRNE